MNDTLQAEIVERSRDGVFILSALSTGPSSVGITATTRTASAPASGPRTPRAVFGSDPASARTERSNARSSSRTIPTAPLDYYVEAEVDRDGVNMGTANALADHVTAGGSAQADLTGFYSGKGRDVTVTITQVQRMASARSCGCRLPPGDWWLQHIPAHRGLLSAFRLEGIGGRFRVGPHLSSQRGDGQRGRRRLREAKGAAGAGQTAGHQDQEPSRSVLAMTARTVMGSETVPEGATAWKADRISPSKSSRAASGICSAEVADRM
jgi:hypothetical protein